LDILSEIAGGPGDRALIRMGLHETGEDPMKELNAPFERFEPYWPFVCAPDQRRGERGQDPRASFGRSNMWMARPAKGKPTSVAANGAEVNWR
jgi:hypothetical protein